MNFALILFVALVVTGGIWLLDSLLLKRGRDRDAREPMLVEYAKSFFPVILVVFGLRSFLVEPFKIPSGSMMPTLLVGDFILVNKYTYGIRLPVLNRKVVEIGSPQRGDVMVFRYPVDPSLDYIKRVIGLPGDRVEYRNKKLIVNGVEMTQTKAGDYLDRDRLYYTPEYVEKLGTVQHDILIDKEAPPYVGQAMQYPLRDRCHYNSEGFVCDVPPGHYFMMGDNRDNSQDSRVWGFVPDANIVGKAFFIWFNFSDLKRIGPFR